MKKSTLLLCGGILLLAGNAHADDKEGRKDFKKCAKQVKIVVEEQVKQGVGKNDQWKQVVEWCENSENWEKMLGRLDEQVGIYHEGGLPITATLMAKNTYPLQARGRGEGGNGFMEISVPAMIQFTSIIQRSAKTDLPHVMEMYLTHELTHCFQQTPAGKSLIPVWPRWMMEGMACYAAEDPLQDDQIKMLGQTGVKDIDGVSGNDAYPRGRLFFKYFHETFGDEKLKAMVAQLLKGDEYKTAIESTTGKKWEGIKDEEMRWAKSYASKKGVKIR